MAAVERKKYTVQNLTPEYAYTFWVVSVDQTDKETRPSNLIELTTLPLNTIAPPAPKQLTATNLTKNSVDLNWSSPSDSVEIAAYGVYQDSLLLGMVSDNTFSIGDLLPETIYYFSVTAWDDQENESLPSEKLQVVTLEESKKQDSIPLLPPANLRIDKVDTTSVSLLWDAPLDSLNFKEFRVYQDGEYLASSLQAFYVVTSLSEKTSYEFSVSSLSETGEESERSETLFVATKEKTSTPQEKAPSAPVNLSVSNSTTNSVELNWSVVEDSVAISSFKVYQDGEFRSSVTNSSLTMTDLLPETVYQFSVSAVGENQLESELSLAVEATTLAEVISPKDEEPPTSPVNLSADEITETSVGISWEAATDDVAVTAYIIYQNGVEIAEITGITYQATALTSNTDYTFEIRAKDGAENLSDATEPLQVITLKEVVVDIAPPSIPQNLTVIESTQTSISLSWGASTDDTAVTGYYIYQNNQNIASVQSTAFDISNLVPATTYRYKVTAYDAEGNESGQSLGVSAMTLPEELPETDKVLVFTKTAGFRHGSIEKGVATFQALGQSNDFEVVQTENSGDFNTTNLSQYKVVVFLNTTGDVLNNTQQAAFENYIQSGGSFMGVHAATDTEYDWPWYGQLVGAYFNGHPKIQEANLEVVNRSHSSTAHLMGDWTRTEEWYNFKDIYSGINPLIMLDESTYEGGTNGTYHPFSWYQEYDGGRVFYTAGGHSNSAYDEPDFRKHLLGGLFYCLER